ncbi:MAG: PD-(D/E)XK nuclease family protein, partial [Oligoflexia bacterium]|nr:PD-(D/E)XK nuclease family protein [Oligoflexia bacterium]
KLLNIGPIPRKELGILILRSKIHEILKQKNVTFIIEEGILGENYIWHKIFENTNIKEALAKNQTNRLSLSDSNKKKLVISTIDRIDSNLIKRHNKVISASRLQCYLDCPRKYYQTNIEKIIPSFRLPSHFTVQNRGIIAHAILELYYKRNTFSVYNKELHLKVLNKIFLSFIEENKMRLDSFDYQVVFAEIKRSTYNTINYLNEVILKDQVKTSKLYFEYKLKNKVLSGFKVKGSVDLIVENNKAFSIYDFKRSSSSIAKNKEFLNFNKIQLWFYMRHLRINPKNIFSFGYINLKSPRKSLIFSRDNNKNDYLFDNFEDRLIQYKEFEKKILIELKNERHYKVKARNQQICKYCFIKNICPQE